MTFPEIPKYAIWAVCVVVLLIGARFRLSGLLLAGTTKPGTKRLLRTARLLGLDAATFASTCILLRLKPFPILICGMILMAVTGSLLWIQWFLQRMSQEAKMAPGPPAPDAPSTTAGRAAAMGAAFAGAAATGAAAAARTIRGGVQGVQDAALAAGFGRLDGWIREKYHANRWVAGAAYQAMMVGLCIALSVMDTLQGPWLYLLFALLWQTGATLALWWQFDRKNLFSPSAPAAAPKASTPPSTRSNSVIGRFGRTMDTLAGTTARPNGPQVDAAGASPRSTRRRRKFALRGDVQAIVALSAGFWCGIFSRYMGWVYGFSSVVVFRIALSLVSPLASGLLGRYLPPVLQPYIRTQPKASVWSWRYLRSREFWYGPGMGLIGGIVGMVARQILLGR